jgi:hypothetical protein
MKSSTRREDHPNVKELAQAPAPAPGRKQGVRPLVALLISGHPEESDAYASKLRLDGYSVVPATGLEQGLRLAAVARPDLIFVCMGAWAIPPLVLLMLRSDPATFGVPTVLVSDLTRAQLAGEVGRLLPTENVAPRSSAVHAAREERALTGRATGCGHRSGWEQWQKLT